MSPSSKKPANKPQRRFQFIDNSNVGATGANSTQVRRHVMQEYMREKRWESRTRVAEEGDEEEEVLDDSTRPRQSPAPSVSSSQKKPPSKRMRTRISSDLQSTTGAEIVSLPAKPGAVHLNTHTPQPSTRGLSNSTQFKNEPIEEVHRKFPPATKLALQGSRRMFYLTPQSFASLADMEDMPPLTPASTILSSGFISPNASTFSIKAANYRASFSPEPFSILSAARTDPFDCLPLKLSKRDQELFDFYATVMPACSYGFERRSPRAHNWYLSVFIPEAMKSPVAFQNTILVHAANTQAWVLGLSETPLAIEHRVRASQMLSQHFQKFPYDISDAAISSTLSAAALEDFDPRIERRKYAWIHWNAAVRKIRDRGGPAALEQCKSLRMLINWSDYIFSGYNGLGPTFYFNHGALRSNLDTPHAEELGREELAQQCEDFLIFLKCSEGLALVAANMQGNRNTQKTQPMRYGVFEPGQPLYNLLASPNGPRYTETGQFKQIISRLAALMTINVAIWEYRYSVNASEDFFQELVENIKHNDLDQHISVEALLQILLSGSEHATLVHTERPWLVGRLLKVAKRLSRPNWERLNDFLLHCLTLDASLRPITETWQNELRAEISGAPLVSYVLPFMQP